MQFKYNKWQDKEQKTEGQDRFFTKKTTNRVVFIPKQSGITNEEAVKKWKHKRQILYGENFEIISSPIEFDEKTLEIHIYDPSQDPKFNPKKASETKISEVHF